jgi:hypothetical protein
MAAQRALPDQVVGFAWFVIESCGDLAHPTYCSNSDGYQVNGKFVKLEDTDPGNQLGATTRTRVRTSRSSSPPGPFIRSSGPVSRVAGCEPATHTGLPCWTENRADHHRRELVPALRPGDGVGEGIVALRGLPVQAGLPPEPRKREYPGEGCVNQPRRVSA